MTALDAGGTRRRPDIYRYLDFLSQRGHAFVDYAQLWEWSTSDLDGFWRSIWDYFEVESAGGSGPTIVNTRMPGARWFPDASINYARHCLRPSHGGDSLAIAAYSQSRPPVLLSFDQLRSQVSRARRGLQKAGVSRGDRVVGYVPNIPEAVIAHLAAASLGAVWAACAPEFGVQGAVTRFAQLEPSVLFAVSGYTYGHKEIDRRREVEAIRTSLPTVRQVIEIPYGAGRLPDALTWDEFTDKSGPLEFDDVPFEHPLVVLFSSGTTGIPKAIVHGHGGILLEHLKNHGLSWDLSPGDVLQWYTTTAWMVWNSVVSGLLRGSTIVLIDGNPVDPALDWQWRIAADRSTTMLGLSPGYIKACRLADLRPTEIADLSALRQVGVVGSPLSAELHEWLQSVLPPGVLINVGSGGTDVCSGIVGGGPLQEGRPGEIAGASLGVAAAAFSPAGRPILDEVGELVITQPMPSMPVGFWGDADGSRYRDAYFVKFPGVWCHGDWVEFFSRGGCAVTGRSDATLNRGGVRLGTAEFYNVLDGLADIQDSLIVHLEDAAGGTGQLVLLVQAAPTLGSDDELARMVRSTIRSTLSPRHVPDQIVRVSSIPRNRTGKRLEVPVKRVLAGAAIEEVMSIDAVADPESISELRRIVPLVQLVSG